MSISFRVTCVLFGVTAATVGLLACGSTDDNATSDGGATGSDAASNDANATQSDGGNVSDGSSTDGSTGPVGIITLSQSSPDLYNLSADFTSGGPSPCVTTMTGACYLTVCTTPAPPADGGTVSPAPVIVPDEGNITVTGMRDAGPAILTYGPIGDGGSAGYLPVSANALFFQGGDMVTASGAGGADLPSFLPQTVVAPDDIVLTSPACSVGSCPSLDRTTDLAVAWTGGGVGELQAFFESVVVSGSNTKIIALGCNFDSSAHAGTVPSSLLMNLGKTGDPGVVVNAESFLPANQVAFMIAGTAASFNLEGQGIPKVTMTVSK
jgi:hypothetical protein